MNNDEFLKKQMNDLPKINAPEGFEEKLFAQITKYERGELQEERNNWWLAVGSSAAGLLIALYAFGIFSSAEPVPLQKPVLVESEQKAENDSVKKQLKPFEQDVIFVKDKK